MSTPRHSIGFLDHVDRLISLQDFMCRGLGESDEADVLREWMADDWTNRTPTERRLIRDLSGDLCVIEGTEQWGDDTDLPLSRDQLVEGMAEASEQRDFSLLLQLCRRGVAQEVERGLLAGARGMGWDGLGVHDAAATFFEFAWTETNDVRMRTRLLHAWGKGRHPERGKQLAGELLASSTQLDHAVSASVHLLFRIAADSPSPDDAAYYRMIVEGVIPRLTSVRDARPMPFFRVSAAIEAALALAHLGDAPAADTLLTTMIVTDPENPFLRATRGVVRRNWSLDNDHDDLQFAVDAQTPLVFPYLHLAEDLLGKGDAEGCLELCHRARERVFDHDIDTLCRSLEQQALTLIRTPSNRATLPNTSLPRDLIVRTLSTAVFQSAA